MDARASARRIQAQEEANAMVFAVEEAAHPGADVRLGVDVDDATERLALVEQYQDPFSKHAMMQIAHRLVESDDLSRPRLLEERHGVARVRQARGGEPSGRTEPLLRGGHIFAGYTQLW